MANDTFTVYYQTGGTANFKWHKALPVATREEAAAQVIECERAGYPARYARTSQLDAIGLPETFRSIA